MPAWTVEYEGPAFERFFTSLPEYEQAVLTAAIEQVLAVHGIDICSNEWGKPLGGGLYEFRVRKSLWAILSDAGIESPESVARHDQQVLLRIFCSFHGIRIVLFYYVSRHIFCLIRSRQEGASMSQKFSDLSGRVGAEWSEETRIVYEAASAVFDAELAARAELGASLAEARRARKLTQPALSSVTGIQQAEISRIERGIGNPTAATLNRLASALGQKIVLQPAG